RDEVSSVGWRLREYAALAAYPPVRLHPHSSPLIPGDAHFIPGDPFNSESPEVHPSGETASLSPWPLAVLHPDHAASCPAMPRLDVGQRSRRFLPHPPAPSHLVSRWS